ncbi:hypothetical protein CALVIDRAFT_541280 [Calocera viscosa TUFC12733]|uniref:Uncharacterized protein n=1 Tax=Calocera viscosa (strain TUFC12733) TaxID=1330018 RepID=A0A167HXH9_CALVF|nr:hypothetical protein CALVIDRAFT_541280 [Calocera viscosa TUFC12733]
MGTRGYRVYRYKRWFFVHYNHWDSYPSGLGLEMLRSIPTDPEVFDEWLASWKQQLESELVQNDLDDEDEDGAGDDEGDYCITRKQPMNDLFIEWIYELDFDNLIFHVDSQPMFKLNCMPSEDIFEACIGFDSYGRRAPSANTPAQHRYSLPRLTMMNDGKAMLKNDLELHPLPVELKPQLPIHELLDTTEELSARDTLRESFLQTLIGAYLRSPQGGSYVSWLSSYSRRNDIPNELREGAYDILRSAFAPYVSPRPFYPPDLLALLWLRTDTFLWITTDLSSPLSVQNAVESSLRELEDLVKGSTRFGLVFSFGHVVVVRVEVGGGGEMSYVHTGALRFLPDPYAITPRTPGITAVARLATRANPNFMVQVSNHTFSQRSPLNFQDIVSQRFPREIWTAIADHVYLPQDLLSLGCSSQQCRLVVADVLRNVQLSSLRLLQPLITDWTEAQEPSQLEIHGAPDVDLFEYVLSYLKSHDKDESNGKLKLYHAAFLASDAQGLKVVHFATRAFLSPLFRMLKFLDATVNLSEPAEVCYSSYISYPLGARLSSLNLEQTKRMMFL